MTSLLLDAAAAAAATAAADDDDVDDGGLVFMATNPTVFTVVVEGNGAVCWLATSAATLIPLWFDTIA